MEELVKVYEYELNRDIIKQCKEEERQITSKDVENEIHTILRDHQIEFRNKIREDWKPRVGTVKKVQDYCLIIEVYVEENQYEEAKRLVQEYLK